MHFIVDLLRILRFSLRSNFRCTWIKVFTPPDTLTIDEYDETYCFLFYCWIEVHFALHFLPQKIFVMPNMDDIWLPIMHSAMDTRSNANLVTVTNDALKDPVSEESEVSDMWRLLVKGFTDGHFITMAIWISQLPPPAEPMGTDMG